MTDTHQLSEADLAGMTPDQINQERRRGRLASILGGDVTVGDAIARATAGQRLSLEDVNRLTAGGRSDLVMAAQRANLIDLTPNNN